MIDSVAHDCSTTTTTPATGLRPYAQQQVIQELMANSDLLLNDALQVRHLMMHNPVSVEPGATVAEMTALMSDLRLHHLPVCKRDGDLRGVVGERDLRASCDATAEQVMHQPAATCRYDAPLAEVIDLLRSQGLPYLPVLDGGQFRGLLTRDDLLLTLQCALRLLARTGRVLQHNLAQSQALDKILASLERPLPGDELAGRVAAARETIRQEIKDLVNVVDLRTDSLTGVSSRQELEEMLATLLAMRARYGRPCALAIVTVDHYQRIRQSCGDAVIRPLLKAVARLIDDHVRSSDFVARCRDDAFAVVLTETRLAAAAAFRQRLLITAEEHSTLDMPLRITVAVVEPEAGETVAELLARAEGTASQSPADAETV